MNKTLIVADRGPRTYSGLFSSPTVSAVEIRHPVGEKVVFRDPPEDDPAYVFEREIDNGLVIVTVRRASPSRP
jgi:hypothetical protein